MCWSKRLKARSQLNPKWLFPIPKVFLYLAQDLSEDVIQEIKGSLRLATQAAPEWGKAWHDWALFNVNAMEHYAHSDVAAAQRHVAPAVSAFFKSVALGQASGALRTGAAAYGTCIAQFAICYFCYVHEAVFAITAHLVWQEIEGKDMNGPSTCPTKHAISCTAPSHNPCT